MLNSPTLVGETNYSCKELPSGTGVVKHYSRADFNPAAIGIPGTFAIDFTRNKTESVMN